MKNFLFSLPEVIVETEGGALTGSDLRTLEAVRVQQCLSLPTLCELTFADPVDALTGADRFLPGAALRVIVAGQAEPLFAGQVTAIEYSYNPGRRREIRVRGYDLLHQLRKRQEVRAHVQVNLRDLAQELVADLGLTVQAAEPGPVWPRLIQHRQSDFDLLQESAEHCGLYLALRGTILHLLTLRGIGQAVPLVLGETLLEARLEINADTSYRSVKAEGWNPARGEVHEGQASSARVGREVAAEVTPARVGGSGKRELVDEGTPDDTHAQGIAQAELDRCSAQEVTLWGVAEGDPHLQPGTPVEVTGVVETLAGRYILSSVTHLIDAHKGFISEISSVPPARRPRVRGSVAAPGIVTRINDPAKLGRICASLPTYSNVETDWMEVLSVGAGSGKGFMAFPDVGDHVLLLFAHEDPGQGVVLGGLYGVQEPPDTGIDGGAVRRYTLLTPGGQRIRLDDGQHTIRLENSEGSYWELSPQKVRMHSTVDLEIEAPGRRVVIRGEKIDFERG
ncbi:MAG TPA: phage baseplate assembly protein V [Ktedonobacteraceae bacterium]